MSADFADSGCSRMDKSVDVIICSRRVICLVQVFFGADEIENPAGEGSRSNVVQEGRQFKMRVSVDQPGHEHGIIQTENAVTWEAPSYFR